MPVRYIFNGYFRSGTTLVWKILSASNEEYRVLYEPFHRNLIKNIKSNDTSNLHGEKLWDQYKHINDKLSNNIFKKNKNFLEESFYPKKSEDVLEHISTFDSLEGNIILQTNRLHYFYEEVKKEFGAKIFHIIRNPYDVCKSIEKRYKRKIDRKSKAKFLVKNMYPMGSYIWGAKENIDICYEMNDSPEFWGKKIKRILALWRPLDLQIVSWLMANYWSLKSLNRKNIIKYEDITGAEERELFEEHVNFKFETDMANEIKSTKYRKESILSCVSKYGLGEKYSELIHDLIGIQRGI